MRKKPQRTENSATDEQRPLRSARARVMDLLARRNYSPLEIRKKLSPDYPSEEIEAAILFARQSKWLPTEKELSERVSATLIKKRKGHRYINNYLRAKGLPPVAKSGDDEFASGLTLARGKLARLLASGQPFDYDCQSKVQRLLANRGFDQETIRAVLQAVKAEV